MDERSYVSDLARVSSSYLETKKKRLEEAAWSVLTNPLHEKNLKELQKALHLSIDQIIETYVAYDLDISKNDNTVYQSLALRYVLHMHNLLKGSWHIQRQQTVVDFIKKANPKKIVDMGFGVPSQYVKVILEQGEQKVILCDIDDSSIQFAEALLNLWAPQRWASQVSCRKLDMNQGEVIPNQDLYLFQSSLEHVRNPADYLEKHLKNSKEEAFFLFSLPIGPITPEHYIAWSTAQEIFDWLTNFGLHIHESKIIGVNPEVDLFADYHNFNYYDCFVLCHKIHV